MANDQDIKAKRESTRQREEAYMRTQVEAGRASRLREEAGQAQGVSREHREQEAQSATARVSEVRTSQEKGAEQGRGIAM